MIKSFIFTLSFSLFMGGPSFAQSVMVDSTSFPADYKFGAGSTSFPADFKFANDSISFPVDYKPVTDSISFLDDYKLAGDSELFLSEFSSAFDSASLEIVRKVAGSPAYVTPEEIADSSQASTEVTETVEEEPSKEQLFYTRVVGYLQEGKRVEKSLKENGNPIAKAANQFKSISAAGLSDTQEVNARITAAQEQIQKILKNEFSSFQEMGEAAKAIDDLQDVPSAFISEVLREGLKQVAEKGRGNLKNKASILLALIESREQDEDIKEPTLFKHAKTAEEVQEDQKFLNFLTSNVQSCSPELDPKMKPFFTEAFNRVSEIEQSRNSLDEVAFLDLYKMALEISSQLELFEFTPSEEEKSYYEYLISISEEGEESEQRDFAVEILTKSVREQLSSLMDAKMTMIMDRTDEMGVCVKGIADTQDAILKRNLAQREERDALQNETYLLIDLRQTQKAIESNHSEQHIGLD